MLQERAIMTLMTMYRPFLKLVRSSHCALDLDMYH